MSSFRGESLEDFADDFQSIFSENEEDDHDGIKLEQLVALVTCFYEE